MTGEYVLALILLPLTAAGFFRTRHLMRKLNPPPAQPRSVILLTKHGDTWR